MRQFCVKDWKGERSENKRHVVWSKTKRNMHCKKKIIFLMKIFIWRLFGAERRSPAKPAAVQSENGVFRLYGERPEFLIMR